MRVARPVLLVIRDRGFDQKVVRCFGTGQRDGLGKDGEAIGREGGSREEDEQKRFEHEFIRIVP